MESWSDRQNLVVPEEISGRADKVLSTLISGMSRSRVQQSFEAGKVWRNDRILTKRDKVFPGETLHYHLLESVESLLEPVDIPLECLFEDDHVIFINKAPGMIVHPGSGTGPDTLVHALLHHCGEAFAQVGSVERPGIVHRLDKGTSGVIVVAKTQEAYLGLVQQFSQRTLKKSYMAIVTGNFKLHSGTYSYPIGRHPVHRYKMAIDPRGKPAETDWEVVERITRDFTLVRCVIHTGRTHQIRVHFGDSGFPLAGDETYGYKTVKFPDLHPPRVMLHAQSLGIIHPVTGESLELEASIPDDFLGFIGELTQ
ncbi:MAG: RluA family pseudouridine synthase [Opitutae bacterium]|jgi:23S rRNA pseudouridine1911/1915/1917 synthase|nr:RluA family pseudouridine synthase [Opitutae bacterium]MBT5380451.1 RluA family pseudouridine synthase [Opitutae bacterium]MBT5691160.1 RluA family pseudouridine synthase [Opitutae bacterium]MBT6462876.1 RluA family pseudouridine synthase [Opitutae bacterium]MBT7853059.1 RluA family pseudouridine synthase [Opitutae bacterium]